MKPLKLKIKGIKSFYDEQEVDFESLSANNIFVICGVTGAGKSTVLDCVILALYGGKNDGLKQEEYINLKCDSAAVSLLFEAQSFGVNRRYEVSRTFYRAKNKSSKAQLIDIESGAVMSEGEKVSRDVTELIGLNAENFTKVIVLEQGKYSQFLKATKKERTAIVGSLFKLNKYEGLYGKVASRAERAQSELRILDEFLNADSELTEAALSEKKRRLKECGAKEKRLAELITALKAKSEKLSADFAAYQRYAAAETELKEAEVKLLEAKEKLDAFTAENGADKGELQLKELTEKLNAARVRFQKIKALRPSAERCDGLKKQLDEMRENYRAVSDELKQKQPLLIKAESEGLDALKRGKALAEAAEKAGVLGKATDIESAAEAARLKVALSQMKNAADCAKAEMEKEERDDTQKRGELTSAEMRFNECKSRAEQTSADFESALKKDAAANADYENSRKAHAAAALAEGLKEGDDCPVCGSKVTGGFKKECGGDLNDYKIKADDARAAADELRGQAAKAQAELAAALSEKDRLVREAADSGERLKRAAAAYDAAIKPEGTDFDTLAKTVDEFTECLAAAETASMRAAALKAECGVLTQKLEGLQAEGRALKQDYDSVSAALTEALGQDGYEAVLKEAKLALSAIEEQFALAEQAKRDYERDRKVLENEKSRREGEQQSLMKNAAALKCNPPDENERRACGDGLAAAQTEWEQLLKDKGALTQQLDGEEERLKQKQEKRRQRAEVAARHDRLKRLMKMFKGDGFLEFVSQEYIEDFCDDASEYLAKMSGGCYTMGYDCTKSEFYVMDFRAGNMKRSVRTLSGGETFLASLSLAIAVAKSIAAKNNAGAKFDFLFLDEGFGTLHRDALSVVERALRSLSGETMVGLVTHRSELSELISDKLIIECATDSQGSKVRVES